MRNKTTIVIIRLKGPGPWIDVVCLLPYFTPQTYGDFSAHSLG